MKRVQGGLTVLLGAFILISPLVLGFAGHPAIMWNSWLTGVAILIVAAGSAVAQVPRVWQEGADLALGLWLLVSPWLLGFAAYVPARNCTMVAGLLVLAIAFWRIMSDIDMRKWMQAHHLTR